MNTAAAGKSLHPNSILDRFSNRNLAACLSISLLSAALLGCSGGTIQGVSGQGVDAAGNTTASEGTLGGANSFQLTGSGVCGKIQIDFGDGTAPVEALSYDFANPNPSAFTHTYTGWAGKKTVKAGSLENCAGAPEMIFTVKPTAFKVGYVPTPADACLPITTKPPLRKNTKVHITAQHPSLPGTGNPGPITMINFGCSGCIYTEDGVAGQAANDWPFPGYRPFSLVVSVGPDLYQGGTDATFITKSAGLLQLCRNESHLANHGGGWGINIDVDESRAQ